MEALGLPVEILVDDCSPNVPTERRRDGLIWSDIVWMYQATDPLMRHNMHVVKEMRAHRDKQGKVWYPATFVIDTDDDLFNVEPTNWAFQTLGIKNPQGGLLTPGSTIEFLDNDRNPIITKDGITASWVDGKNGFDIRENITRLENYRMLGQTASAITCTTPAVVDYVKREFGKNTKTFINPNGVRFDHYLDLALAPHKGIRVMWQGSNTHYNDLYSIHKAISRVAKKYPEVTFVFWGARLEKLLEGIPQEQLEYIPWLPYAQYHLRLVTVGPDINLCPLRPSPFSATRSAIKWYEASVLHDPAATVAQRAGAYKDEIEHGKTGLLYDTEEEFEQHLCTLIEDTKLRKELAANAKDWLHENRDAFKLAPKLFEFFCALREQKHATTEIEEEDATVPEQQPDVRSGENKDSESSIG